jgi:hypothetical protein
MQWWLNVSHYLIDDNDDYDDDDGTEDICHSVCVIGVFYDPVQFVRKCPSITYFCRAIFTECCLATAPSMAVTKHSTHSIAHLSE